MPPVTSPSSIVATRDSLAAIDTDLVAIPWFEDDEPSAVGADAATRGEIARAIASQEFQAKPHDILLAPVVDHAWRARRIMLIGAGRRDAADIDLMRKLASTAGHTARQRRIARAVFAVRGLGDAADLAQAAAEGVTLADFNGGSYKTTDPPPARPGAWTIAGVELVLGPAALHLSILPGRLPG